MKVHLFLVVLLLGSTAFAEKDGLSHESELAIVNVDGNTSSESYSAKQKTDFKKEAGTYTLTGRYLQAKAEGVETARNWAVSLRYEREFSATWSAFLAHGAEADPSAGYVQRDNSDLGGKYFFQKSDERNFFTEFGYRYTKTRLVDQTSEVGNYGRLYTEYELKQTEGLSYKVWVEYLPNFTESNNYFANAEASVTVMLSQILSLKTGYLAKYHNELVVADEKRLDTALTTSLVAKF